MINSGSRGFVHEVVVDALIEMKSGTRFRPTSSVKKTYYIIYFADKFQLNTSINYDALNFEFLAIFVNPVTQFCEESSHCTFPTNREK